MMTTSYPAEQLRRMIAERLSIIQYLTHESGYASSRERERIAKLVQVHWSDMADMAELAERAERAERVTP